MATRVKICGIRTAEVMAAALQSRADMVGLVFFPPSPRNVTIAEATPLAALARGNATSVALVVDAADDVIGDIVAAIDPDMLQLHGSESPARTAEIRSRFRKPVIKAIKVAEKGDAEVALAYTGLADIVLFDAKPPKGADRPGGHGAAFDWGLLAGVRERIDFMLSGGLTAANVAEAIRATGAPAVDVSSGVEISPGVKDANLVREFIRAAKSAPAVNRPTP